MDVPLSASRLVVDGRQYVEVWTSKGRDRVDPPFLPYAYARTRLPAGAVAAQDVTVRPLSTLTATPYVRHTFPTVHEVQAHVHPAARPGTVPGETADDHVPFVHRILLDRPDWFRSFPHGRAPRLLTLDVEQLTSGGRFPTRDDPLIAIAWAVDGDEPESVLGDGTRDDDLVEAFVKAMRRIDPDLVSGYNVAGYDLPLIVHRCRANRVDPSALSRTGRLEEDRLGGRIVYDVYDRVKMDQTLYGIKDRKLKTVAAWRGIPAVKEDTSNTAALVGTPRLRRYNESDVRACREVGRPYLRTLVELAGFYGAPLNVVMDATPNFHCTMLQGRVMVRAGVVSDGTNAERYPRFYQGAAGEGFVGGIVELYRRGLFRPLYKVDFSSMYPSILVALGLGADNTRFVGEEGIGDFAWRRDGTRLRLSVPDPARGVNHVVEVDGRSALSEELGRLLAHRLALKKAAKATKDPAERERLEAQQAMVKVILNSVYGVMASRHARYGAMPVAVAIVGTARRLIRLVEEGLGDAKIETDTDGVYTANAPELAGIEASVNAFVHGLGGEPTLRLDASRYEAGWFHERKSYVVLHADDRLEKHGIAFKGSSRCGVFDTALDRIARTLLSGADDADRVAQECLDLSRYAPDDFVLRIRMGKALGDYESDQHVAAQVARAYEARGLRFGEGQQLDYVKTRRGYDAAVPEAMRELDHGYYLTMLKRLIGKMGVEARDAGQRSLAEWG